MADLRAGLNQRRLRLNPALSRALRSSVPRADQLMQPYFVAPLSEGHREPLAVPGLTGVYRETPDSLLKRIEGDLERGVRLGLLFGMPARKSQAQGGADPRFDFDSTAGQIRRVKERFGADFFLAVDVCLCSHTDHGHCGVLTLEGDHVENDATVRQLAAAAAAYAQAGADCVAPSDMMDGRIKAIRAALDGAGREQTILMSYAVKFHSRFYGPFRVAADSAPKGELKLTDRATYQIDPANARDAMACARRDAAEGADILMVKPGLPYLDVLARCVAEIEKPWAVYEVSGEYAAIELMAREGLMKGPEAHVESWTALTRAGASLIITYGARQGREWLENL